MKQLDIYGNFDETWTPPKKHNKTPTMQERFGILEGKSCRECKHCVREQMANAWYKCDIWLNSFRGHSAASDIRLKNPACGLFEERGEKMKILSLFDGMACGMIAFKKLGIPVSEYHAYEVDKYAVETVKYNFPEVMQHGDVFKGDFTKYKNFDWLIGGSPCTYWSIAQSPDKRETTASGLGWELFSQYVRAQKETKPEFFLYENNKSMSRDIYMSISDAFGFEPVMINSALVSAQNRWRYYWVGHRNKDGIYEKVEIAQPKDRGLLLKDVLEIKPEVATSVCCAQRGRYMDSGEVSEKDIKLTEQYLEARTDGKTNALLTVQKNNVIAQPVRVGALPRPTGELSTSTAFRLYDIKGKSVTLKSSAGGAGGKTGLYVLPVYETKELSERYYHGDKDTAVFGMIDCKNTSDNKGQPAQGTRVYRTNKKSVCLDCDSRKYIITEKPINSMAGKTYTVYHVKNGLISIKGKEYPIKLADGFYIIRNLTVTECKRLQTVPEDYVFPVSNTQAYKMLGNGWTVDIICHLIESARGRKNE